MPRGSRVLVADGSEDAAVAEVTARTIRRLAGWEETRRNGELRNGTVLTQRKVEKIPVERAIVVVVVRWWIWEDREVLRYPCL